MTIKFNDEISATAFFCQVCIYAGMEVTTKGETEITVTAAPKTIAADMLKRGVKDFKKSGAIVEIIK